MGIENSISICKGVWKDCFEKLLFTQIYGTFAGGWIAEQKHQQNDGTGQWVTLLSTER